MEKGGPYRSASNNIPIYNKLISVTLNQLPIYGKAKTRTRLADPYLHCADSSCLHMQSNACSETVYMYVELSINMPTHIYLANQILMRLDRIAMMKLGFVGQLCLLVISSL